MQTVESVKAISGTPVWSTNRVMVAWPFFEAVKNPKEVEIDGGYKYGIGHAGHGNTIFGINAYCLDESVLRASFEELSVNSIIVPEQVQAISSVIFKEIPDKEEFRSALNLLQVSLAS